MLSAGAFSDDEVVDAAKDVVCVYVDLAWGQKNMDLGAKYAIEAFPTVVYADPDGEEVGRMRTFEPGVVADEIGRLAREHGKKLR